MKKAQYSQIAVLIIILITLVIISIALYLWWDMFQVKAALPEPTGLSIF